MSSETITRNDLTAILNEVLPIQDTIEKANLIITGSNTYSNAFVQKMGKIVHLTLEVNFDLQLNAGTYTQVGTIPEGYRPKENYVSAAILGGTYGFVELTLAGEIRLQRTATSTSNLVRIHATYFTN